MKTWGCIFALPMYSIGFLMLHWLVPMPTYLAIILSPFITGNLLVLTSGLWQLHKVNRELRNIPNQQTLQNSKN